MGATVRWAICVAIALTFTARPFVNAQSRTFYVATTGSDANAGTSAAPWLTLRYAVAQLRAGDRLYIRGGTYTGSNNVIDSETSTVPSGTSWSSAITIAGAPGEIVTIRVPNTRHGIRLTRGAPHYLIFQDFTIDMVNDTTGDPSGIYLSSGAHHNRFQRLEVKNSYGNAITFSNNNANSPFNEVLDCSIHDNGRGPGINSGYGAYVVTSDNLFAGNDIYNNAGYGLHFYNNEGPMDVSRNVIRNNKIRDNGTHGGTNFGIVVAWGADNQIYNNLIYRNRGGIFIYNKAANTQVYNNTIYNNLAAPDGSAAIDMVAYASPPVVRNNILYRNAATIVNSGGTGTPLTSNNLTADPKFENAASNDFRLQEGSPAEDAGAAVTSVRTDYAGVSRPQGSAYDIGAYERQRGGGAPSKPRKLKIVGP